MKHKQPGIRQLWPHTHHMQSAGSQTRIFGPFGEGYQFAPARTLHVIYSCTNGVGPVHGS